jgi:hypothetical protein
MVSGARDPLLVGRGRSDEGFGLLTSIKLPDGGELGLYEPRHPLPPRD